MDPDPRTSEEAALRKAVLRGDATAWRALYDGAFAPVYRYVHCRTGRSEERTEEIVQEIWMVAVRKIREFDPHRSPFEAWLKAIAARVLKTHWRTGRKHAALESDLVAEPAGLAPAEPDLAEQIALAMTDLPSSYQSVLRERYEHDLSVAEIAEQRGTTHKAAESLLSRARRAFRAAYARIEGGHP